MRSPEAPAQNIRAAQADLLDALPGVHLPDLGELRTRGVLGAHPTEPATSPRRRPHKRRGAGSLRPAPGGVDDGGPLRLALTHPEIAIVRADSAYAGKLVPWAKTYLDITIKTVRRPPDAKGFDHVGGRHLDSEASDPPHDPACRTARRQPVLPRASRLTQVLTPAAPHQRAPGRGTALSGAPHHVLSHGWNRHRPSETTSTLPSLTRTAVSSSMK
ncbi:hypothetical protein OK006_11146 [Actinobacteria bacterium OK006]|nr:hypothetical protein OK006_11146 [Actinobacteria bacterium OK006]